MFELDTRLANDTVVLGDFKQSRLLLAKDSRYPWCILVPKRVGINEMYQLSAQEQAQVTKESALLGQSLMTLYQGDSLNVAALGNVVAQLHIHHVVRYHNDPCWPGPIWGVGSSVPFEQEELLKQAKKIIEPLLGQLGFIAVI